MLAGAHDEGRAHLARALDHFRRAGDLPGQAFAHVSASLACGWTGDWPEAVPHGEEALALFRETGFQVGQGRALAAVGECHAHLWKYDLARGYARQALEMTPEDGDPSTLAFAWHALGVVHSRLGDHRQAIRSYRQAVAFARKRENSLARGMLIRLLAELGDACRAAGDLPTAVGAWRQALQILDDLRLPDSLGVGARLEKADLPSAPG